MLASASSVKSLPFPHNFNFLLVGAIALAGCALLPPARAQVNVVTYHNDVARTGQNTRETWLTPANVNKSSFGFRFNQPVDGFIVAQPLYLSNVSIPGAGTHNVVYVATLNDSVYAFDADNNTGSNSSPLWHVNFTNPASGITTASGTNLPCQGTTGYTQSGIVSTPVIDPTSGTMYVVAKTNENGTVYHRLHALDVTTGIDKFAPAVPIQGSFTTATGTVVTLNNLHAMNRPALLLNDGVIYIAFGSNGCNDSSYGWVLAYNATNLTPLGVFNTVPQKQLGSIWHTGSGPAADSEGNVYVSTAEGDFNANIGGQDFGSSFLKLFENNGVLAEVDYFTPYNQAVISENDQDLSASGVLVLPDQPGSNPHVLIGSGKQGTVYVLNRDNMGHYNPLGDTQILQELPLTVGAMFSSPVYWNNFVYFAGNGHPIMAYALSGGILATPPFAQSVKMAGGHAPAISANGNINGLLWVINGTTLYALDAVSLKQIYTTTQSGTRDVLPAQPNFSTQMVANGKVYVGTMTNLMVLGLLPAVSVVAGNNQTAAVVTTLPIPLQVQLTDPYTRQPIPGVTLNFADGSKGGTFSNPSGVTDSAGTVTTTYTFGKVARTVTITVSNSAVLGSTLTETATPAAPKWLLILSGQKQTAPVTTPLPAPLVTKVSDQYGNGIPGMTVAFADGGAGGSFSSNSVVTDSTGHASTNYTTSTKAGAITLTANAASLPTLKISETVTAGPPSSMTAIAGNNQTGPPSTTLPVPLTVKVSDQYGNAVSGASVTFTDGGVGGSFSVSPVITDSSGQASSSYTTPSISGVVSVTASVGSVSAQFTETAN